MGRTHYVDDDTLRFHKARILDVEASHGGLLYTIIESCTKDYEGRYRGYRHVTFDLFGTVISRVCLEDMVSSTRAARKKMQAELATIDAIAVTRAGLARLERNNAQDVAEINKIIGKMEVL